MMQFNGAYQELLDVVASGEVLEASFATPRFRLKGTTIMAVTSVTVRVVAPEEVELTPIELTLKTGQSESVQLSSFATHQDGSAMQIVGFPEPPVVGEASIAEDRQSFTYKAPAEKPAEPVEFTVEVDFA